MALPATALSSTSAAAISSTQAVVPPPTPPVSLVSSSSWTEPFPGGATGLHIVGQVQNTTPAAFGNAGINVSWVRINISLNDATLHDSSYTYATVGVLGPNEVSPFELDLVPEPAGYSGYSIGAITYTPAIGQPYHSQLTAQLTSPSTACPQGGVSGEVCGTVTNTGLNPVENVLAILTYMNGPTTVAQEHPLVLNAAGGTTLNHNDTGSFDVLLSPGEPVGTGSPLILAEPMYPLDINPDHLDFGPVNTGKSGQLVVTVANTGSLTVTFNAPFTNPRPEFTASSDCPNSGLSGGQSCHLTVTFTPAASGLRTGTLTLTDTAAGSQQVIPLTGQGTAPAVTFDRAVLDFGSTVRAGATGTVTENLTNTGDGPLTITAFATDDATDFSVDGSGCLAAPFTIQPGGRCPIVVTFHPQAAGPYGNLPNTNLSSVNLIVTDDAGTGTQKLPLQGIALGPGALLTTNGQPVSRIDFGDQPLAFSSAPATVTLVNNGTEALTISKIAAGGDFGEFDNCPPVSVPLAAGASCTITITYTPSQLGPGSGSLTITDNANNSPQSVALTGNGVSGLGNGRRANSGIDRARMPPATIVIRRR